MRLDDVPNAVEFAITVIDAWQGRGIGSLLTARLCHILPIYGIESIHAHCQASNFAVDRLLSRQLGAGERRSVGGIVSSEFSLASLERAA